MSNTKELKAKLSTMTRDEVVAERSKLQATLATEKNSFRRASLQERIVMCNVRINTLIVPPVLMGVPVTFVRSFRPVAA